MGRFETVFKFQIPNFLFKIRRKDKTSLDSQAAGKEICSVFSFNVLIFNSMKTGGFFLYINLNSWQLLVFQIVVTLKPLAIQ